MDITISTMEKDFSYAASYLTDPLNDLLDATALLLRKQAFPIRGGWCLKDNAIVVHDQEGEIIVWLLNYSNNIFKILIWENISEYLLEDLCECNFDGDIYTSKGTEELPDLAKGLIFAVQDAPHHFAKILKQTCENLDLKYSKKKHTSKWGYNYSKDNLNFLTKFLVDSEK